MTVNANDVIRVTAKMSSGTNDLQNVWHFKGLGTGTAPDDDVVDDAAAEMDGLYTLINAYIGTGVTYDTVEVFNVTQDAPVGEVNWPVLVDGDAVGETLYAPQVAALVLFGTNTARSQGRKFLGGLAENAMGAAGQYESAFATVLASFAANAFGGFSTLGLEFEPGNYNYVLDRFAQWVSATIPDRAGTQRRRRAGVGS